MANLNDVLQGLVNINSKMANNINNLLDSIGEGLLDIGELTVSNGTLNIKDATILVNGSNITIDSLTTEFSGNKICFLEYCQDKTIIFKVLEVVDENFNYDLSQLSATSKHFEIARQYNDVFEDRRITSMASKDNTIVGALNGALKAIDYNDELDLEINMDILSRVSAVESDIQLLDIKKADISYVDDVIANADIDIDLDGVVTAVDVGEIEGVENPYVTKEELDEALSGLEVDVDLTAYQEKSDNSLSTTNKTIVGAINELFQSANNGKELIASSIGEPLSAEDTFQAMSNDINSLLATFKANMMNNGITVEANDKFKSLIDKISTIAEESGNKGMKFASGTCNITLSATFSTVNEDIPYNLDFTPTYVFLNCSSVNGNYIGYRCANMIVSNIINNATITGDYSSKATFTVRNISNKKCNLYISLTSSTDENTTIMATVNRWYAIGVGEEDTTLRDSLANILQDSGVGVTEEDDMASLISKVDSELDEATSNKNRLCELMSESGYDVNNSMSLDSLLDLLELSGINTSDIKQIACGYGCTFILKTNGSLWCCGYNNYGQLGLNDTTQRTTFTQVTTNINNDVTQVACGQSHTIIQKKDGTLWACGYNNYGQLGLGDTNTRYTFERIANNINNDVKQIVCGANHTVVLKTNGSLWGCGYNNYGQLGLNNTTNKSSFTQVTANINNDVKQVACGDQHTFIIKTDGSLWGCGYNYYGQLGLSDIANKTMFLKITTNINNDVKQISCGIYHTFIIKNDGSLWSCGYNNCGQLGLNNTTDKKAFTKVTTNINNDVKRVSCGDQHTFIIKTDGSLWSCGYNSYGQLGLNNTTDKKTFTKVTTNINNDVKRVSCGGDYTVIIKTDGSLWGCGYNRFGQLGLNNTDVTTFTTIPRGV